MSADLSSSATPSRLLCRKGRWQLELTRLIAVDNHIFQPRNQRVEGAEAILSHLKRSVDVGLAQSAAQLMRSMRGDEERSFNAVDGEWVPMMPSNGETGNDGQVSALELALSELRAEVLMLRASHQRLRRRVEVLEARSENLEVPQRRSPERAQLTPLSFGGARAAAETDARPATLATANLAEQQHTLATGRMPDVAPAPGMGQVVAKGAAVEANGASINPSTPAQVIQTLTELFGGEFDYKPDNEPLPESALELVALYACQVLDDDGNHVAAVLADIRATASLGGKLAAMPQTVIEEQAKTGVLNDTVTAAMSEVCNTLTTMLTRVGGNQNLRSSPLESFPVDRMGWVRMASHCLAFSKPRGGTFWLVIR